jgi:glycosyltransferase involved in cell wall biosynthesis
MRVLQVVSLLSPDGAFGGPARVALNQSAELVRQGHHVTLAAGTRGYRVVPTESHGVALRLFPVRTALPFLGFSGMTAPGLTRWARAHLDEFDVVHIHLGRDLMVLPVAALARRHRAPYVLQTHGMVIPSRHPLAGPLDTLWTRRILAGAAAVFYLTDLEREQIRQVAHGEGLVNLVNLPNGVPDHPLVPARSDAVPEVLFLGRLHARKRPVLFVQMARRLLDEGVRARFTLVGPDEGEGPAVLAAIGAESRIRWEGPVDPEDAAQRLAQATAYVLPAEREPYPMAVLEAMSVGVPVVVCPDCGLAPAIRDTGGGKVANGTVEDLTAAVKAILSDAGAYGRRARATARRDFGMRVVVDRLLGIYRVAATR